MLRKFLSVTSIVLAMVGIGLILKELVLPGIMLLFVAAGIRLADFRVEQCSASARRLVAKGSPALLMIALMLAAAQGYLATVDAVVLAFSGDPACPLDTNKAQWILVRMLELLR